MPRDNENRTLDLLRAMAQGKLTIDADAANTVDTSFVLGSRASAAGLALSGVVPAQLLSGEHTYSGGAPGLPLALAPVHAVLRRVVPERSTALVWLLTVVGAGLPLALGAVAIRRAALALGTTESAATLAALVHSFATIALPFATRLYAHSLVIALLAWGLALLLESDAKKRTTICRALIAGGLGAWAFASDYSAALPASVLFLLALERGGLRSGVAFALGAIPPVLVLGAYHDACFGSPLSLPYDHRIDGSTRALLATGAYGFTLPSPTVVLHLLGGPRRGVLLCEPAVFLGVLGLFSAFIARGPARRPSALALLAAVGVFFANASRTHDWAAGFSFGPRYASAALPFLALGYPRGLALAGRAALPVLAASTLVAFAGATTDWTFSLAGTFEQLWLLGLHEGVAPRLAAALFAAALLLAPRGRFLPWAALALVPLALEAPRRLEHLYRRTPPDVERREVQERLVAIERREGRRSAAWALDADEARSRAEIARFVWRDPEIYFVALRRIVELDPSDAEARAELERVRAELDKARRAELERVQRERERKPR